MPGVVVLEYPLEAPQFVPPPALLVAADCELSGERHLVLATKAGRIRLCIRMAVVRTAPTFVIVSDAYAARRFAAAAIADRALQGSDASTPKPSAPTVYQRHRLTQMLRVHDALAGGATLRDIAFGMIFQRDSSLNGAEWRGAGERRHTQRLVAELRQMIGGGYRKLLLSG